MSEKSYSGSAPCVHCGRINVFSQTICIWCGKHPFKRSSAIICPNEKGPDRVGVKYDEGKIEWSLVIPKLLEGMIKILMFGAKKYSPNNWMKVDNAEERYYNAAMRHLTAMMQEDGTLNINAVDDESGKPHLWHLQCCIYFLEFFRQKKAI